MLFTYNSFFFLVLYIELYQCTFLVDINVMMYILPTWFFPTT